MENTSWKGVVGLLFIVVKKKRSPSSVQTIAPSSSMDWLSYEQNQMICRIMHDKGVKGIKRGIPVGPILLSHCVHHLPCVREDLRITQIVGIIFFT